MGRERGDDLLDQSVERGSVRDKIDVVSGNFERRGDGGMRGPIFIKPVQILKIAGIDRLLIGASAVLNAFHERGHRGLQIDNERGRRQERDECFIEVAIGLLVALAHVAAFVQVAGKNFRVFIHTAVLNNAAG